MHWIVCSNEFSGPKSVTWRYSRVKFFVGRMCDVSHNVIYSPQSFKGNRLNSELAIEIVLKQMTNENKTEKATSINLNKKPTRKKNKENLLKFHRWSGLQSYLIYQTRPEFESLLRSKTDAIMFDWNWFSICFSKKKNQVLKIMQNDTNFTWKKDERHNCHQNLKLNLNSATHNCNSFFDCYKKGCCCPKLTSFWKHSKPFLSFQEKVIKISKLIKKQKAKKRFETNEKFYKKKLKFA